MRIAQISPLYESVPPKLYGGTERVVSYLTEELVRQGHEVTLFASGDSVTSARLVPGCERSLRLDTQCIDPLARHFAMLGKIYREASEFDMIHFHIDYLHFPTSRTCGIRAVTTLHGRLDFPDLVPVFREFSEMPVISISESQRKPLPWANWQGTVHHGLPLDLFQFQPKRGDYLAFLGRVSPEKGIDRAIEIAKRTGMTLKIAAKVDRVDHDYFESVIKPLLDEPNVEFIGEIRQTDKNDFLGNAYATLFPVDWPEPFGLVMIESMACGTPVVAFRRGSIAEVLSDGVSGFIVEDVDGAVKAVEKVAGLDRAGCRQAFEKRYAVTRMAEDYLAIYQRMLERVEEPLVSIEPPKSLETAAGGVPELG